MYDLETIIAMNNKRAGAESESPDSDRDMTKKKYAEAGHKLMQLFIAEGWQPEDLEVLALRSFIDIREVILQSIRMNRT